MLLEALAVEEGIYKYGLLEGKKSTQEMEWKYRCKLMISKICMCMNVYMHKYACIHGMIKINGECLNFKTQSKTHFY